VKVIKIDAGDFHVFFVVSSQDDGRMVEAEHFRVAIRCYKNALRKEKQPARLWRGVFRELLWYGMVFRVDLRFEPLVPTPAQKNKLVRGRIYFAAH